jgi:hypothetical protein
MTAQAQKYYVLRVKGKAKIPDYLQIRDENFTLIGYIRPNHSLQQTSANDAHKELFQRIEARSADLPYGIVTEIILE